MRQKTNLGANNENNALMKVEEEMSQEDCN